MMTMILSPPTNDHDDYIAVDGLLATTKRQYRGSRNILCYCCRHHHYNTTVTIATNTQKTTWCYCSGSSCVGWQKKVQRNNPVSIVMVVVVVVSTIMTGTLAFVDSTMPDATETATNKKKTIAVIGGGISGSFVTKYITDYDINCQAIDTITIFDPKPTIGPIHVPSSTDVDEPENEPPPSQYPQGSRIRTLQLKDGTMIELGASIGYNAFYHVLDMIKNDESLEIVEPFSTGTTSNTPGDDKIRDGLAIYHGKKQWKLITTGMSAFYKKIYMTLRYNWDLYKLSILCQSFLSKWSSLPNLLNDTSSFFPENPDDIWNKIHLLYAVHMSFAQLLDHIGIAKSFKSSKITSKSATTTTTTTPIPKQKDSSSLASFFSSLYKWIPSVTSILPFHGSIRDELLTAVNLVNYNQNNEHVNGVVGMASFAASLGGLFSIKGGNYQVITSAFKQAEKNRIQYCHNDNTIRHLNETIATVLGNLHGFTLYNKDNNIIGQYDIVILAVPIQFANIQFYIQSHMDPAVIQPMPLGGLLESHEHSIHYDSGRAILPTPLPPITQRPYKQVTTTVVRVTNNTIDPSEDHLLSSFPKIPSSDPSLPSNFLLPKSIMMTNDGKYSANNITAITYIQSGYYKIFSDTPLNDTVLFYILGTKQYRVEYVQFWGHNRGGATPDYQGQGTSANFLLYDGANGLEGHTSSGALYYPCAMEQSSLSSMEIAAVGAKAVAKLIARRCRMIQPNHNDKIHDEL